MSIEYSAMLSLDEAQLIIANHVYDTIILEEQRINREIHRLEERLAQNQVARVRYEQIIRHLTNK